MFWLNSSQGLRRLSSVYIHFYRDNIEYDCGSHWQPIDPPLSLACLLVGFSVCTEKKKWCPLVSHAWLFPTVWFVSTDLLTGKGNVINFSHNFCTIALCCFLFVSPMRMCSSLNSWLIFIFYFSSSYHFPFRVFILINMEVASNNATHHIWIMDHINLSSPQHPHECLIDWLIGWLIGWLIQ